MAAYAAVASLMNTTDVIINHPLLSTSFDEQHIQSLTQKLGTLLQSIEDYNSSGSDKEVEYLESKIASAAHRAEDVIKSQLVDRIHAGVLDEAPNSLIDLKAINQSIDHLGEEIARFKLKSGRKNKKPKFTTTSASSQPANTSIVGFDAYSKQLLDALTSLESTRQVIPIVGMGGIGKTALARNAYENSITVRHFDARAWVTIYQQYNVREIFMQLLSSLGLTKNSLKECDEEQLSERLYKYLYGRRYLVVLDDMWSLTAWERIRFFFPEDNDSSRIIVTTRLSEVGNCFGSSRVVVLNLLDDNTSWDLFCQKAFVEEHCPADLEQIGKAIVKKCRGHPLSIVVIGALLGKSSKMKEYWENVAEDINMILHSTEDKQCYNILSLSYNHLPACLKPCFLYLGIYPEDHELQVSEVIELWIAEGFVKPDEGQTLEEVAEGYLNDLLGRNLILVGSLGLNKRCETFFIHDLVRDLCLRIVEKFFNVMRGPETPWGGDRQQNRHVVIREGTSEEHPSPLKAASATRSLIGEWGDEALFQCRLLRVLFADYDFERKYYPKVGF